MQLEQINMTSAIISNLWTTGTAIFVTIMFVRRLDQRFPIRFGRRDGRRSALRLLAKVRRYDRNPRTLIAGIGQRLGFIVFLIGAAVWNGVFLSAGEFRILRKGDIDPDFIQKMLLAHIVQMTIAAMIMVLAVNAVDQLRMWADPVRFRRSVTERYRRFHRPPAIPS
jgi:hypothetical protein